MKKKISFVLIALLLVVFHASVAFAATGEVSVSSASGKPGDTVTVTVSLDSTDGLAAYGANLVYDNAALKLTDMAAGDFCAVVNKDTGFATGFAVSNVTSGTLFTATFEIIATTEGTYPVSVSFVTEGDATCNAAGEPVAMNVTAGAVTVSVPHVCAPVKVDAVPATCTATGTIEHYKCACGKLYADAAGNTLITDVTAPALGHAYDNGVVTTKPGCDTPGVKTYTCQNDSQHTYTEEVPATGHAYDNGVVTTEPGCETPGVKTYTCQNDSQHTYTEEVAATGHAYDNGVVTTKPGCETPGVKTYTCQNDNKHTYTEEVPAAGHAWDGGVVTTPGTCANPGVKTYTCTSCGATRTEAYGGAHDDRMGGDATHHWHYCAGCGEVWDKEEHSFDKNGKCVCGYNNPAGGNSDLDDVPDTGDITPIVTGVVVMIVSLMIAVAAFVFKRKAVR